MKSDHIDSPVEEKPYPVETTSQETNRQPQDSFVKVSETMEKHNELSDAGISSATCSQNNVDAGSSSNDVLMTVMNLEELEVLNVGENADFCEAVSSGNVILVESMLEKNPGLAEIELPNRMLPIHMAASSGHGQIVHNLFVSHENKFRDLTPEEKVLLFFTALKNNIFDLSYLILEKYLAVDNSRDEDQLTALHVLARKSPMEFVGRHFNENGIRRLIKVLDLIDELCNRAKRMKRNEMLEFLSKPSGVLFDAVKSGNFIILDTVLKSIPELLMVLDSKRRSLFHTAVLYRERSILSYMKNHGMLKDLVMQVVDDDGNNILHMVGMISPDEGFGSSQPDIQMQEELLWFKLGDLPLSTCNRIFVPGCGRELNLQ